MDLDRCRLETTRQVAALGLPVDAAWSLVDVLLSFAAADPHVGHWAAYDGDSERYDAEGRFLGELPDCDEMSDRFTRFAQLRGLSTVRTVGPLVAAPRDDLDPMIGEHWFSVVTVAGVQVAVDFTAPQFHDVTLGRRVSPSEVPVPLVFAFPGAFPLYELAWSPVP